VASVVPRSVRILTLAAAAAARHIVCRRRWSLPSIVRGATAGVVLVRDYYLPRSSFVRSFVRSFVAFCSADTRQLHRQASGLSGL